VKTLPTQRVVHRGFTLVEMLVVIAIIGILVGLVTGAAMVAMRMGKKTVVKSEIGQLDLALKQYKADNGEYPADGSIPQSDISPTNGYYDKNSNGIPDDFERHFGIVFTRANVNDELTALGYDTVAKRLTLFQNYTPMTALVFWLGGMPENINNPNSRLIGFSQNKINPLSDTASQRTKPYFEFDSARLTGPTGQIFRTYVPSGLPSVEQWNSYSYPHIPCYVYFRAEGTRGTEYFYAPNHFKTCPPSYSPSYGGLNAPTYVRPYWDEQSQAWVNADSFQILFCGFDGKFGISNIYKSRKEPASGTYPALWKNRNILRWPHAPLTTPPGTEDPNDSIGVDDQTNFGGTTVVD
jgi:prepilin-type N-terminal cleavage/methylation domain-containing protein